MTVFIDTSAFYAFLDDRDDFNSTAKDFFEDLISDSRKMVTSNYIVLETTALIQARIGLKPIKAFHENMIPMIQVMWINDKIHQSAINFLIETSRRELSLVDCTSFAFMRSLGIQEVFTFDRHFSEQGFAAMPR